MQCACACVAAAFGIDTFSCAVLCRTAGTRQTPTTSFAHEHLVLRMSWVGGGGGGSSGGCCAYGGTSYHVNGLLLQLHAVNKYITALRHV